MSRHRYIDHMKIMSLCPNNYLSKTYLHDVCLKFGDNRFNKQTVSIAWTSWLMPKLPGFSFLIHCLFDWNASNGKPFWSLDNVSQSAGIIFIKVSTRSCTGTTKYKINKFVILMNMIHQKKKKIITCFNSHHN